MCSWTFYYMELELNTIIGDPAKLGRDCEIHQHKRLIYSFIICYIRMIVFVGIIQILMFYNVISFSHWLPDVLNHNYYVFLERVGNNILMNIR